MTVTNNSTSPIYDINIHQESEAWHKLDFDIESQIVTVVTTVLQELKFQKENIELSVVLADDKFLNKLNKSYRQQDKPTNILSFGYGPEMLERGVLGDLFLSYETLEREAHAQKKSLHDHFIHLLIHGTLHLLGYDHENEEEAEIMENLEIKFLQCFNISNPYTI